MYMDLIHTTLQLLNSNDSGQCNPIIYFIIFIVYVIAFSCMYIMKVELIGIFLLYFINLVASVFIVSDFFKLTANTVNFSYFIGMCILLIFNVISSTFFVISIYRFAKFSYDNDSKNKLIISSKNRMLVHKYKSMFISIVMCFIVLFFLFFTIQPFQNKNYPFIQRVTLLNIFKAVLILYTTATSSYLVYLGNRLLETTNSIAK